MSTSPRLVNPSNAYPLKLVSMLSPVLGATIASSPDLPSTIAPSSSTLGQYPSESLRMRLGAYLIAQSSSPLSVDLTSNPNGMQIPARISLASTPFQSPLSALTSLTGLPSLFS